MSTFFSQTKEKTASGLEAGADALDAGAEKIRGQKSIVKPMAVPVYSDIAKAANDLLAKDFYHVAAANLEVKTKAPNGVAYTIKGKSQHEKAPTASLEGKYAAKDTGMTGTVAWSSMNLIDVKVEADNNIAPGLKIEALSNFKPDTQDLSVKSNAYFKHGPANVRLMADLMKQTTNFDLVFGQQGFLVGGEAGYDVQKAAISRYSATVAYQQANHTAAVTASNSFSIFTASLYNKVNAETEIGIKATWDSKSSSTVGMDFAAKYKLDPLSFVKGKIDDRGVAAVSYNTKLNSNLTFGVGTSFDTQKLNEGTHKVGCHFAFDG